jgi:hypothetical protein
MYSRPSQDHQAQMDVGADHHSLGVSSAIVSASSSCDSAKSTPKESGRRDPAGREYVEAMLDFYLWLPGTPRSTSRYDRRYAKRLFERGVPLAVVETAMIVAVARRTFRTGDPLPPIRAVAYFGPAVEEVLELAPDTGYVRYLKDKLRPLAQAKVAPSVRQASGPSARV